MSGIIMFFGIMFLFITICCLIQISDDVSKLRRYEEERREPKVDWDKVLGRKIEGNDEKVD